MKSRLGNGAKTLFWEDRWLPDSHIIRDFAPQLHANVHKRAIKVRTVRDALGRGWWEDVNPDMSAGALGEFLLVGDKFAHVHLD